MVIMLVSLVVCVGVFINYSLICNGFTETLQGCLYIWLWYLHNSLMNIHPPSLSLHSGTQPPLSPVPSFSLLF